MSFAMVDDGDDDAHNIANLALSQFRCKDLFIVVYKLFNVNVAHVSKYFCICCATSQNANKFYYIYKSF